MFENRPRLSGRSMGTEQEITNFMDSYRISDPYCNDFNTLDTIDSYTRLCDIWICASFPDENLTPVYQPKVSTDHVSPIYNDVFSDTMTTMINNAHHSNTYLNCSSHTTQDNLWRFVFNKSQIAFREFRLKQYHEFLLLLKDKDFVKKRTEPELIDEIKLRKNQFPGHKLYTFVGGDCNDWIEETTGGSNYFGTQVCVCGYNSAKFGAYESGVVAEPQIATSQQFFYEYYLAKIPRRWDTRFSWVMKSNMTLEKCQSVDNQLAEPPKKGMEQFNFMSEL